MELINYIGCFPTLRIDQCGASFYARKIAKSKSQKYCMANASKGKFIEVEYIIRKTYLVVVVHNGDYY